MSIKVAHKKLPYLMEGRPPYHKKNVFSFLKLKWDKNLSIEHLKLADNQLGEGIKLSFFSSLFFQKNISGTNKKYFISSPLTHRHLDIAQTQSMSPLEIHF